MRDGCDVSNHRDLHTGRLKRAESGLPAAAGSLDLDAQCPDTVLLGLLRAFLRRHLGRVGGGLSRPLEALLTCAGPRDGIPADVGDGDNSVIEGRLDMSNTSLDIFLDLLLSDGLLGCHMCALLLPGRESLARDALGRTLACPSIGVGALTSYGEMATMSQPPITTDVHQHLDVLTELATKVTLDLVAALDDLSKLDGFAFAELFRLGSGIDPRLLANLARERASDSKNISQRYFDSLVTGQVHTCNSRHAPLLWVLLRTRLSPGAAYASDCHK